MSLNGNIVNDDDKSERKYPNRTEMKLLLVPTKKSGNYCIYKKVNNMNERIQYTISGVYFPFGDEKYNENTIYNIKVKNDSNYKENILFDLRHITNRFKIMAETDGIKKRYNLEDKVFYEFLKDTDEGFLIRTYLKYGAKITHKKIIGILDSSYIKGKYGNVVIEIGSLWVNRDIGKYGVNIYLNQIVVL